MPCTDLPPLSTAGAAGSVLMLSCTAHRSKLMLAPAHSMLGASKRPKSARSRPAPSLQIGFCFRLDGLHANGLVSYAFDAKQLHNKQHLREAGGVRRDVLPHYLYHSFTLGQRVKLRLAEPINAALEFRA